MYQEFYYIRNRQNIVAKSNLYCPVNTKWLSRDEFKAYILQIMKGECWDIQIVSDLPEDIFNKTLYFVVNGDLYDIYADNEDQRVELKVGGGSELYIHKFFYHKTNVGSTNFVFINNLSTPMGLNEIYYQLDKLGCYDVWHSYPANGTLQNRFTVIGLFNSNNKVYMDVLDGARHIPDELEDMITTQQDIVFPLGNFF